MRLFLFISFFCSVFIGFLPILLANYTDHGDEICDPEKYYAPVRDCVILLDRAVLAFGLYFCTSVLFFACVGGIIWIVRR